MKMKLSTINLGAYIVLFVFNYLSVKVPFFGRSAGDVSDIYPNLLTPPDFFFRIWMLIYILLGVFSIGSYIQEKKNHGKQAKEVEAIGYLFLVTSILSIGWLVTWQLLYIPIAFFIVFVMWLVLMRLYYKLSLVKNAKWIYTAPMSIYFGWICIATLACMNVFLFHINFSFFGMDDETWTSFLIGYGICGTLWMLYLHKDIIYTLTIAWAFCGMFTKSCSLVPDSLNKVAMTSVIGMAIFAIIIIAISVKRFRQPQLRT